MPHSAQAKKRLRQSAKLNLHNRGVKNEIKTLTKKLLAHIEAGEKDAAQAIYPALISKMDKAARRHIYHTNTVARKKSQVTRRLASLAG